MRTEFHIFTRAEGNVPFSESDGIFRPRPGTRPMGPGHWRVKYGQRVRIHVRNTKAHDSGYVGCSLRTDGDYVREDMMRKRTKYEKRKAMLDFLAEQGLLA